MNWYGSSVFPFFEIMRKTTVPLVEKAFSTSGTSFQNFIKSSENFEFKWYGEPLLGSPHTPFLPVDEVFR
jgi:hypothetical protein